MSRLLTPGRSTALFAAILCAACMVYYHLALFVPRALEVRAAQDLGNGYSFGADFYPIWFTAREGLHHRDPYSPEMTRQIQIGLFGRPLPASNPSAPPDSRAFANPAFAEVLIWPLALLSFPVVRIALAVILPLATAFSVVLWLRSLHLRAGPATLASTILLTLSSYAVLEGLFAEQMGLLVGFFLAAALAALVEERLFLSGGVLALTLIKPQLMLLLAVYLLLWSFAAWRSRWRFAGGFLLISAVLVTSALLIWPQWIPEWLKALHAYRQYSTPPLVCYLLGLQLGSRLGQVLIVAVLLSAVAVAWRARLVAPGSGQFALTISLLLALTAIALLPGNAVYDHVILLPGVLLIASSWRALAANRAFRAILAATALAVCWQWISAPVVVALRPFLSRQLFVSDVLTLPIRTAASIPFGIMSILGMMMWQGNRKNIPLGKK